MPASEITMATNGHSDAKHSVSNKDTNGATENMTEQDNEGKTREEMENFWKEHSANATEEEMMLDSNAEQLGREEIPEILSLLPNAARLDVLELGAGIGRFTGHLAAKAKSVTAVDFMEAFIEKNRQINGHHGNAIFRQADVTKLQLPPGSYDLVFSNWLLMYLEEHEVQELFCKVLQWLRPGGYFFFRESCFHPSGNAKRQYNPTRYRDPGAYTAILQSVSVPADDNPHTTYAFEMIMSKSVQTYIKLKNNGNQICWLVHKEQRREMDNHGFNTNQEFLDKSVYSLENIHSYEWIFGEGFISSGGITTTVEFTNMLNLCPGEHVLDVGSGIGGSAFHMAQEFDVKVTGIDLSANMVSVALEKAYKVNDKRVQFEMGDVTKRQFPLQSFDAIYSRETLHHIEDKVTLLSSFFKWLKPGGRLVITDYCCRHDEGSNGWSNEFKKFVQKYGYHLLSVDQYAKILIQVGFGQVQVDDRTSQFLQILNKELQHLENVQREVTEEFSVTDYRLLENTWKNKMVQCASGEHKYGVMYAKKD